jgi:tRNA modification GTPase
MKTRENDTITAIITPQGEGGIAVIRLSGPDSIPIADRVFRGHVTLHESKSQTVHFGTISEDDGNTIDEVLVTLFRSPHSYTTEDVVEISCHGSPFIARKILGLLVSSGARPAGPGEFTRRAFLNGRIDLSQAEAVADIIRADSTPSHALALAQLRGDLSSKITELRRRIVDLCSLVELELDFSEEGVELVQRDKLMGELQGVKKEISQLIDSYEDGKIHREGLRVVLAGPPNVGKSSILNKLIRENRAIVTDVSGTTRDTIEESVILNGMRFNIVDTAGLRETHDIVEVEGIKRTREQISHADLILLVIDPSVHIKIDEDIHIVNSYLLGQENNEVIIVFNKSDLVKDSEIQMLETLYPGYRTVVTSTKTGSGLEELERIISGLTLSSKGDVGGEGIMISNLRQRENLRNALISVSLSIEGVENNLSGELLSVDLRRALSSLSEVVGEDISEEVLNNIFLRFCIGK